MNDARIYLLEAGTGKEPVNKKRLTAAALLAFGVGLVAPACVHAVVSSRVQERVTAAHVSPGHANDPGNHSKHL